MATVSVDDNHRQWFHPSERRWTLRARQGKILTNGGESATRRERQKNREQSLEQQLSGWE